MTSRSKKTLFPTFATRSIASGVTGEACRFCPDWAIAATSDASDSLCDATEFDDSTRDAREFSVALERYRLVHRRRVVSCEEAVAVFKSLGYRKSKK